LAGAISGMFVDIVDINHVQIYFQTLGSSEWKYIANIVRMPVKPHFCIKLADRIQRNFGFGVAARTQKYPVFRQAFQLFFRGQAAECFESEHSQLNFCTVIESNFDVI
jgi:hypothetical protein